jgi:hypothetical protein
MFSSTISQLLTGTSKDAKQEEYKFQQRVPLERRKLETKTQLAKYTDAKTGGYTKIPIVAESGDNTMQIRKCRFLFPSDFSFSQAQYKIKQRLQEEIDSAIQDAAAKGLPLPERFGPEKALFYWIGNTFPSATQTLGQIYKESANEDGFLYIVYRTENTFG